jgi:hypothetical protein
MTQSVPEQLRPIILEGIREYKRHIIGVLDAEVPFCYSIGNALEGIPDFIIAGATQQTGSLINTVSDKMLQEKWKASYIRENPWFDLGGKVPVFLRECPPTTKKEFTVQAGEFYGFQAYDLFQIVMPDINKNLPGSENYDGSFLANLDQNAFGLLQ